MRDPPADAVMPEPTFAPKPEPVVVEAPCAPAKVEKQKKKAKAISCDCDEVEQPSCCSKAVTTAIIPQSIYGKEHHVHITHDATGDDKGLAAIAKTAIEVMARPEPLDSLARRAQENMNENGVSDEAKDLARKALGNQDGGDIQDMAKKALDNLNNGQAGAPGDL